MTAAVIPAPPPDATTAAGYLTIENASMQDVRFTSAVTDIANRVSLHENSIEGGIARMRPLTDGLVISAGQHVSLEAARDHLMLEDLKRALAPGDVVPVTLIFTPGGEVEATFTVKSYEDMDHDESGHNH